VRRTQLLLLTYRRERKKLSPEQERQVVASSRKKNLDDPERKGRTSPIFIRKKVRVACLRRKKKGRPEEKYEAVRRKEKGVRAIGKREVAARFVKGDRTYSWKEEEGEEASGIEEGKKCRL